MPASLRLGGWRSVGALVMVAAVAAGIGQAGAGHSLLEKVGLIQQPTGYTALSFKEPDKPVSVKVAGKRANYKVWFRIQNAETRPHTYRWSLLLMQRPGHAQRIASRPIVVGPGETASIPRAGKITCEPDHNVEFTVQLVGTRPAEAIHAWTICPRPRS